MVDRLARLTTAVSGVKSAVKAPPLTPQGTALHHRPPPRPAARRIIGGAAQHHPRPPYCTLGPPCSLS